MVFGLDSFKKKICKQCMDAASESESSGLAGAAAVLAFLAMVWSLVAWSVWCAWGYIINLQFDASVAFDAPSSLYFIFCV